MADNFSVSKDSLQLPYRRFLADSAAGLSLLLLGIAAYYLPVVSDRPLRALWNGYMSATGLGGISTEAKVFTFFLLFLLATPIGFAVNAVSWLLIDYPICGVERLYFRWARDDGRMFPLWDVTKARFGTTLTSYFGLTEENFNQAGWFFRDVLEAYVPDRFETQTHIKGLVVFLRNLTLFTIILAFVSLGQAVGRRAVLAFVVVAAAGTIVLLVSRWGADKKHDQKVRIRFNRIAIGVTSVSLMVAYWCSTSSMWAMRSVALLLSSIVLIAIIGMVEYYYHDAILLHAYFACCEYQVDAATVPAQGEHRFLELARQLIRKVGEEAREKKKKD